MAENGLVEDAGGTQEGAQDAPALDEGTLALTEAEWLAEAEGIVPDEAPEDTGEQDADDTEDVEADADSSLDGTTAEVSEPIDWVKVLRESPHRATEIPAKQRDGVWRQVLEQERAEAVSREAAARRAEREAAEQQFEARQRVSSFVTQVDQLRRDDPDEYFSWEENPQNAQQVAVYHRWKADKTAAALPQPQQQSDPRAAFEPAVKAILQTAQSNDTVMAEIRSRDAQGRYPATPEGLTALQTDVIALMTSAAAPQQQAPGKREQAAATRRQVPKPDVSPAASPKGRLTASQIDNMSVEEMMRLDHEELDAAVR